MRGWGKLAGEPGGMLVNSVLVGDGLLWEDIGLNTSQRAAGQLRGVVWHARGVTVGRGTSEDNWGKLGGEYWVGI